MDQQSASHSQKYQRGFRWRIFAYFAIPNTLFFALYYRSTDPPLGGFLFFLAILMTTLSFLVGVAALIDFLGLCISEKKFVSESWAIVIPLTLLLPVSLYSSTQLSPRIWWHAHQAEVLPLIETEGPIDDSWTKGTYAGRKGLWTEQYGGAVILADWHLRTFVCRAQDRDDDIKDQGEVLRDFNMARNHMERRIVSNEVYGELRVLQIRFTH